MRHGKSEVRQLIQEEGMEAAADHVCQWCRNFIPEDEQSEHDCMGDERGFAPSSPWAPV